MRLSMGNFETHGGELRDLWRKRSKYMQGNYGLHGTIQRTSGLCFPRGKRRRRSVLLSRGEGLS